MKSLRHRLFEAPLTFGDCLDRARNGEARNVEVCIEECQQVGDSDILLRQWIAIFKWHFPGRTVICEKVCGATRLGDARDQKARAVVKANRRLADLLRETRSTGVEMDYIGASFTP